MDEVARLRRHLRWGAFAFLLLSVWVFHELWQLEHHAVGSVRIWAPAALLYRWLGFWPAVLFLPALGGFTVTSLVGKIRRLEASQGQAALP